jgi:hypothetical protein
MACQWCVTVEMLVDDMEEPGNHVLVGELIDLLVRMTRPYQGGVDDSSGLNLHSR